MVKRMILAACVLSPLFLIGCGALPLSVNVPITSDTVIERGSVVEQIAGGLVFDGFTGIDVTNSEEFKASQAQKRYITGAQLKKLRLTITDPEEENFNFLNEISFHVNAPGLEKQRIAHANVPRGVSAFDLDLDDVQLAPYVKADSMTISATVNGRRPDTDTTVRARLVLNIETALWGAAQ